MTTPRSNRTCVCGAGAVGGAARSTPRATRRTPTRGDTRTRGGARNPDPAVRRRRTDSGPDPGGAARSSSIARPGSGLRHQHTGGPAAVRAVQGVHLDVEPLAQPRQHGVDIGGRPRAGGDLGLPRQPDDAPALVVMAAQHGGSSRDDVDVVGRRRRAAAGSAAHEHAVAPHEQGAVHVPGGGHCRSNGTVSMCEKPSASVGGFELALHGGTARPAPSAPASPRATRRSSSSASSRPCRASRRPTSLTCASSIDVDRCRHRTDKPSRRAASMTGARDLRDR